MRSLGFIGSRLARRRACSILAAGLLCAGIGWADGLPPDRVEALRQALRAPGMNGSLTQRVQALETLAEMRRALALQEWRPEVGGVAEPVRALLADRFKNEARRLLQHGSDDTRLAVMDLLAETGPSLRGPADPKGLARALAPELVALLKNGAPPRIRQAAARTLGLTFPDPGVAVNPLLDLLASPNREERRAAVRALVSLLRVANQLSVRSEIPGLVQAERSDIVQLGTAILPVAGIGLADADAEIRRSTAEALEQAAAALNNKVPEPRPGEPASDADSERPRLAAAQSKLMPLMEAFRKQGPALAKALRDSDLEVRLRTQRALEELGNVRMRLYRGELLAVTEPAEAVPATEPLLQTLQTALPVLAADVADPNVQARLGAIDALESIGPAAGPAASTLARALADPDRFVRWAAARTLGKIGTVESATTVPGLVRLLVDPDLDVRLAAALALDRYGPAAKDAVADLMQATQSSDAEMRIAALRTLKGIGAGAPVVVPALAAALSDPNARVRRTAAEALGRFGSSARSAESALRKALDDPDPDVCNAASDALLGILQARS